MARLAEPKKVFLKEGESFTWHSRNMPVYSQCDKDTGDFLCISHDVFLTKDKISEPRILGKTILYFVQNYEEHTSLKQTHEIVWYCHFHKLMEEA